MAIYTPPDSRFGLYGANTHQGVSGGIPARTSLPPILATDYGFSISQTAAQNKTSIESAIAASGPGDVVLLPEGTFPCNGFVFGHQYSYRTVRGDGAGTTLVSDGAYTGKMLDMGSGTDPSNAFNPGTTITAMARGSDQITVVDGSMPHTYESPGAGSYTGSSRMMATLQLPNELVTPVISPNGTDYIFGFPVVITARSGNVLTLSRPLPSGFADALAAGTVRLGAVSQLARLLRYSGVERVTFQYEGPSAFNVGSVTWTEDCWLDRVEMSGVSNHTLYNDTCVGLEIRRCRILGAGSGSNHSGTFFQNVANSLYEDNYSTGSPAVEFFGYVCNSVFAFNYIDGVFNCNHAPGSQLNLYEGNWWAYWTSDGYFGPSLCDSLHGNYAPTDSNLSPKRFTYKLNSLGNLTGTVGATYASDKYERWGDPNIGNTSSVGTAQFSIGDYWDDWTNSIPGARRFSLELTTRTDDRHGIVTLLETARGDEFEAALVAAGYSRTKEIWGQGFVHFGTRSGLTWPVDTDTPGLTTGGNLPALNTIANAFPNPGGFQEQDQDVLAGSIRKENWFVFHGGVKAGEELGGGDTLPASYFRATKPDWFGNLDWPPYDYASPGTPTAENLPAGYREINGNEGYIDPTIVATPSFSPAGNTTYATTQTVTITGPVGATIRYTTNNVDPTNSSGTIITSGSTVSIPATAVLKAIAYDGVLLDSLVRSATFTITPVPTAPSSLTATAVSTSQINLAWTDNASTETGFRILKGTVSGALTLHDTVATPGLTSYNVTGLAAATPYFFVVQAYNAGGNSTSSNEATATTISGATPGSWTISGALTATVLTLGG